MALPPCHMLCQFYVHLAPQDSPEGTKNGLSCLMFQRSADLGLGIPFNIASYAILTHMCVPALVCSILIHLIIIRVAQVTGTEARELIIQLGDAHVYRDHVDALRTQLTREPKPFPTIRFKRSVKDIDDLVYEDVVVEGYESWPAIAMKMSV